MLTLTLVRHGTTALNVAKKLQGQGDGAETLLNEEGRADARRAAAALKGVGFDGLIVSPATRARETARLILEGHASLTTRLDPRLLEIDFGTLQGTPIEDWMQATGLGDMWREATWDKAFPQGESYLDLLARTRSLLEAILTHGQGKHFLLVSHASPVKFQLALLAGLDPREAVHRTIPNAAVYTARGDTLGAFTWRRLSPLEAADPSAF